MPSLHRTAWDHAEQETSLVRGNTKKREKRCRECQVVVGVHL